MFTDSFWSLLPPIIAIALALLTKEVYSSLFIGILVGGLLYSGFSFTVNEDGKIYYNNYEIKDENEIINSNIFDYEHLNENISNTTIPFSLYFNRIKMINDTINLLIFPVFCDSNDLYLENKICKISKNNEEIINILINNRNSNLLKYMTIEGKNSQFKIMQQL